MNRWPRSVPGKAFWWGFCGVGIVVASCTYATGAAAAPMRVISAKETMTMGPVLPRFWRCLGRPSVGPRAIEGDLAVGGGSQSEGTGAVERRGCCTARHAVERTQATGE